ncbi:Hypothetical_protein [Hexamita inflata]|uniref:Hypothetical_protein n=1 Tax=Hexamita inflata TaxID=28002 RepID=A0AA86TNB7_9EUKA|nr:Hypothetical protein HINF_LOCUS8552 [Hexamita inflata]
MKNISLLLQVVTVRTSSDPSSFINCCYIKYSSQLNSTFVQNSSSARPLPRLKVDELKVGQLQAKYKILLDKSTTKISQARANNTEPCSIYMIVDLFKIQIYQSNNLEHQIFLCSLVTHTKSNTCIQRQIF